MPVQLSLLETEAPSSPKNRKRPINVFFAIFLPAGLDGGITGLAQQQRKKHGLERKIVAAENFHVSLINLGESTKLPGWALDRAQRAAASLMVPPFELTFDRIASFSGGEGNRPLVLCGGENAAFKDFCQKLGQELKLAQLIKNVDDSFTPHVTLLYDKFIAEQRIQPVRWTVQEFVLVRNREDKPGYERLGSWPLQGPPP